MKLYSVCFGLLVVFVCPSPSAVSDFCQQVKPDIQKLRGLTEAEISVLTRSRREAIAELRDKYKTHCGG